jgi:hypothetical protein
MILKSIVLAAFALSLPPQLATAQGNLVVNGGFDTDASGWIATYIGANGGYQPSKGDPGGFFFLDNTPSPSTYPTISQTINGLIPTDSYVVSGNYAYSDNYGSGSSTDPSFGVAINGIFLFEATIPTNADWQNFSFLYTATSASAVLSLSSQVNGTTISYLIDNISMYAVPEPGILSLLGLGGLAFLWHRRKAKAI